ncbi:hypothetical protein ACEQ8H_000060 [Pleosporales sp. CAS-2024a]
MLYSSLVAASALALASAQSANQTFNTPIPCCSVSAGIVPSDQRSAWCEANINTCVDICGGQGNIASNGNTCDDTTLQFTCQCSNGTNAATAIAAYEQSVPAQMCEYWYGACVNATDQRLAQQYECEKAKNATCGTRKTSGSSSGSSSSSASPSATRTGGSSSSNTSPSGAASSAPASKGAAASIAQYGTSLVAAGLLALFGLAL